MKLLREPLVHFVVAGAVLFAVYGWLDRGAGEVRSADQRVVIGEREVAWLTETWQRQRQRPPSPAELQGLVADYLREELLAREARELELDRDDTVVRRRLAQKMEFLLADTAARAEPSDADLRKLYAANADRFAAPATTSFEQVFVDTERRGEGAEKEARRVLAALSSARDRAPESLGDPTLLPAEMTAADERRVAGQFGPEFATSLAGLPTGEWTGPVRSAFGLHLVRVKERAAAEPRAFDDVRDELVAEWNRGRDEAMRADHLAQLLRQYDVEVAENLRPLLAPSLAAIGGAAK